MAGFLSGGLAPPYNQSMDDMTLPPELGAVAAGRHRDLSEMVAAGLRLRQRQEQARTKLLASVLAAQEEAEREGCVTGEEMVARVRARLAETCGAAM
jgi:Arc/MetJ-type ribon-helix-helix transcriptional regulator